MARALLRQAIAVVLLTAASGLGAAAGEIDVSLAGSWLVPALDATYAHSFTPRIDLEPASSGSAGHTLHLAGENGYGLRGTLGVDLGGRLGLELLVARSWHNAGGASSPYAYSFEYTARQPPSNEPQTFLHEREQPWPDAEGRLRQLALGLSLRLRFPLGRSATLGLAAGPSLHRVSGEMESLAWTHFFLGGHSVLFEDTFRLGVELPGAWTAGLHLGGALDARLGSKLSLILDLRYFLVRDLEVRPEPSRILNTEEILQSLTLDEIAAQLPLAALRLDPSFFSASGGVRLRF